MRWAGAAPATTAVPSMQREAAGARVAAGAGTGAEVQARVVGVRVEGGERVARPELEARAELAEWEARVGRVRVEEAREDSEAAAE
jgi:hypothetical protein